MSTPTRHLPPPATAPKPGGSLNCLATRPLSGHEVHDRASVGRRRRHRVDRRPFLPSATTSCLRRSTWTTRTTTVQVDVPRQRREMTVTAALNDSFGFGGHNVACCSPRRKPSPIEPRNAMTLTANPPVEIVPDRDPRDPELRLTKLLRPGQSRPIARSRRQRRLRGPRHYRGRARHCLRQRSAEDGRRDGHRRCAHIVDAIDTALRERVPVIGLWHSGGARLAEGVEALHAVGDGLRRDGARFGPGPANLGRARSGRGWRCLRSGADRPGDHVERRAGCSSPART